MAGGRTCLICGQSLPPFVPADEWVCAHPVCRHRLSTLPAARRCAVCGRPLAAVDVSGTACKNLECQAIFLGRLRAAELARQRAANLVAGETLRDQLAQRLGILQPSEYPVQCVPVFQNPLTPLPHERRDAFVANLRAAIEVAFALEMPLSRGAEPPSEVDCCTANEAAISNTLAVATTESEALGQACATCRGYCCRNGGLHAFLTPEVLTAQRARHPERSAEATMEAYVAHLPAKSFEDSCVFQSATGCALPSDMRAQVCHDFLCPDLQEYRERISSTGSRRAFLISANGDGIVNSQFVEDG